MKQDNNRSDRIFVIIASVYLVLCVCVYTLCQISENSEYIDIKEIKTETETEAAAVSVREESLININTATVEELMTLDGIGRVTAEKIIEYRENNNGFLTIDELTEVSGIGPAKFEKIRNHITVADPVS